MLGILLTLFIALPLLDLYLLLQIADILGLLETAALIIITGLIGVGLLKQEGVDVLLRLQTAVYAEEAQQTMIEAALLAVGGILLLSPGIITDTIGVALVFSSTRQRLASRLRIQIQQSDRVTVEFGQL